MNVKKLALIGAIALVVIGCVLAAGCTSNQSTTPATPTTAPSTTEKIDLAKELIGTWEFPIDEATAKEMLNKMMKQYPDYATQLQELGTENLVNLKEVMVFSDDGSVILKYVSKTGEDFGDMSAKCTWKKVNETAIQINAANGQSFMMLTFDPATKTLKEQTGTSKYTKIANAKSAAETKQRGVSPTTSAKDFIGTWVASYDDAYAKKMQELSPDLAKKLQELGAKNLADLTEETVISEDGSVTINYLLKTGEKIGENVKKMTWELINETTLKIDTEVGSTTALILDPATKTLKYYGEALTYTKTANA